MRAKYYLNSSQVSRAVVIKRVGLQAFNGYYGEAYQQALDANGGDYMYNLAAGVRLTISFKKGGDNV